MPIKLHNYVCLYVHTRLTNDERVMPILTTTLSSGLLAGRTLTLYEGNFISFFISRSSASDAPGKDVVVFLRKQINIAAQLSPTLSL